MEPKEAHTEWFTLMSPQGTVGASNGGVRKSKFGPPVDQAIPPPSMLTSQVVAWSISSP